MSASRRSAQSLAGLLLRIGLAFSVAGLLVLSSGGCGRYGKPIRRPPAADDETPKEALPEAPRAGPPDEQLEAPQQMPGAQEVQQGVQQGVQREQGRPEVGVPERATEGPGGEDEEQLP